MQGVLTPSRDGARRDVEWFNVLPGGTEHLREIVFGRIEDDAVQPSMILHDLPHAVGFELDDDGPENEAPTITQRIREMA